MAPEILKRVAYTFTTDDAPGSWYPFQIHWREAIHETYELDIDLVTATSLDQAGPADLGALLGARGELGISRGDHQRTIYGIVAAAEHRGVFADRQAVRIRLLPAFALARQRVTSRIFQDRSVAEILTTVLGEALGDYGRTLTTKIERGKTPRDYCTQYRESDFDFAVRLMEEEGISYHFSHDDVAGHEVLVLTDENSVFVDGETSEGSRTLPIVERDPEQVTSESIGHFTVSHNLTSTAALRRDFNWQRPTARLNAAESGKDARGRTRRLYEHGDRRFIADDLAVRAQDTVEAERVGERIGHGVGNVIGMSPGLVFEIEQHDTQPEAEGPHVITRVVHQGVATEAFADGLTPPREVQYGERIDYMGYSNVFECTPLQIPVRPRASVPKPRVHGPQTAMVVGASGEEIHTDAHGRIKVQFHWEENGAHNQTSSCWVRVSQSWAGKGWGHQFIPRIGMEVVVSFLEGNPDRPLVTGCVYNGDNDPPFALPAHKTRSGIRTDSSIGEGFNELRFEDAAGQEEVYIHAQKDKRVYVRNDHAREVGNDESILVKHCRTKEVKVDQRETIGNDKTIDVHGHHRESVTKDYTQAVGGNTSITIGGNRSEFVKLGHDLDVGASASEQVKEGKTVKVGARYSETVKGSRSMRVKEGISFESGDNSQWDSGNAMMLGAAKELTLKAGKAMDLATRDNLSIQADKNAIIEIKDQLTLKCGDASIVLKKNGDILINGSKLNVKCSGDVNIKGSKVIGN